MSLTMTHTFSEIKEICTSVNINQSGQTFESADQILGIYVFMCVDVHAHITKLDIHF
jgi:hypothetical protein